MKKHKTLIIFTIVALFSIVIYKISRHFPDFVTKYYSNGAYNLITAPLKWITHLLPFSIGEIVLLILVICIILTLILSVYKTISAGKKQKTFVYKPLLKFLAFIIILAELAVSVFIWSGGLNYNSQTIYTRLGYNDSKTYSAKELYQMTVCYIEMANTIREALPEEDAGNLKQMYNFNELAKIAGEAYVTMPEKYNKLLADGFFTNAKPALFSKWMCYTNITGIYPYMIPEPVINKYTPVASLGSTVCHEMAHQRAIAREDEANFISFIACINSENSYLQYSGYYSAIINCLNSLYSVNYQLWTEAWKHMSDDIKADINYSITFWDKYDTKIGEISEKVNDTYLQANNIKDGVASYGRLTDLLLADYYSKGSAGSVG
ncbi:MAG: DUF3810 domain-containing protein [Ruminococcaceae bacterium]|nr:DUF3810 domain-containing protein [Oscillospiraceae bacterium]